MKRSPWDTITSRVCAPLSNIVARAMSWVPISGYFRIRALGYVPRHVKYTRTCVCRSFAPHASQGVGSFGCTLVLSDAVGAAESCLKAAQRTRDPKGGYTKAALKANAAAVPERMPSGVAHGAAADAAATDGGGGRHLPPLGTAAAHGSAGAPAPPQLGVSRAQPATARREQRAGRLRSVSGRQPRPTYECSSCCSPSSGSWQP